MLMVNNNILKLKGPIIIFGAGGFVGINLLKKILKNRADVIGISSDPDKSWRIKKNQIPKINVEQCNILDRKSVTAVINKYRPRTIFNLAAYGAYSTQKEIEKIYLTNFNSTINIIETLKKYAFNVYIHAGSQSEYGLNCYRPQETDELIPNSHYAVSKTAVYYLLKYYGRVEKLPVVHLRLYSVYGPWEEPGRLIPTLINNVKKGQLPPLVNPDISRDFIYIDDVVDAIITIAVKLKKDHFGEVFNVAAGKKTTIKELAQLARKLFKIKKEPVFNTMKNRDWDLKNWVGNPKKMQKTFGWKVKVSLEEGLLKCFGFNYEK